MPLETASLFQMNCELAFSALALAPRKQALCVAEILENTKSYDYSLVVAGTFLIGAFFFWGTDFFLASAFLFVFFAEVDV